MIIMTTDMCLKVRSKLRMRMWSQDLKQAILDCVRESIVPLVSPKVRLKITLDSEFMPKLQLTNLTHLERNRIVKLLRKKNCLSME